MIASKEDLISAISKWTSNSSGMDSIIEMVEKIFEFSSTDAQVVNLILMVIAPIAYALIAVYFAQSCLQELTRDRPESARDIVARNMVYLIMADMLICNAGTIIGDLMGASNVLAQTMKDALSTSNPISNNISESMYADMSWPAVAVAAIGALIGHLVNLAAYVMMGVTCFSLKLELNMKLAFSPLGLAGLAESSHNPRAMEYLKSLFASALTCAASIALVFIGYTCGNTIFKDLAEAGTEISGIAGVMSWMSGIIELATVPFAIVGSISSAKSIINETLGTH